jgi:hypothetical protein
MPRVALTVSPLVVGGVAESLTAGTADDMQAVNDGNLILYIENTNATNARTVTIIGQGKTAQGTTWTDETLTIAAAVGKFYGPFSVAAFNTSGVIQIDLDAGNESDLSLQAFKFVRGT